MNNKVSIVSIGDEILIGQIIDTNSAWLGNEISSRGGEIVQIVSCKDDIESIMNTLDYLSKISEIIILTGGLGPTNDDVTKKALANYTERELTYSEEQWEHIVQYFNLRDRKPKNVHKAQALSPAGANLLNNSKGTALGIFINHKKKIYISLPGVPDEMKAIMNEEGFSAIGLKSPPRKFKHTFMSIGTSETVLSEILQDMENSLKGEFSISYLPNVGGVRVRLTNISNTSDERFNEVKNMIGSLIAKFTYGEEDESIEEVVATLLTQNNLSLSTAESCTGGTIAKRITRYAGASKYFYGSVVAYSNDAKVNILGVSKQTLEKYGAVSEETVKEMVKGSLNIFNCDVAISTSGIAGPGGGTELKPVGTIWVACGNKNKIITQKLNLGNDRVRNIKATSQIALNLLRKFLLA